MVLFLIRVLITELSVKGSSSEGDTPTQLSWETELQHEPCLLVD